MKTQIMLLALACSGCELMFGIGDTKLAPDASIDAAPDAPPDAPAPKVIVGTGKDGPLVVASTVFTDDVRTSVSAAVGAGSTLVNVASTTGFAIDDEVLVIQMTGEDAGKSETRNVKATTATSITLDRGLANTYSVDADNVVQLIRVANYTDVTVPSGARLTAHVWDGATGGVVFFRASGTVRVASGGTIDAVGGLGGTATASIPATPGGLKGFGGIRVTCPLVGCGSDVFAPGGSPGEFNFGMIGGGGVVVNKCHGGPGGRGGKPETITDVPLPGNPGTGAGGATTPSGGGAYLSTSSTRPMIGGGGAGGTGAVGGGGAGGGGGGGAPIAGSGTNGGPGTDGAPGGEPGVAGDGGSGGGIVWIHANSIENDGTISVSGAPGVAATNGTDGGAGGDGGDAGGAFTACAGAAIHGGRGGGGHGAGGGGGGNGGGGGAGGTLILEAFMVKANGMLTGLGGAGNAATTGGMGGPGGMGFGGQAPTGAAGAAGVGGGAGADGRIYIFYVNNCTSCEGVGQPAASVMAR